MTECLRVVWKTYSPDPVHHGSKGLDLTADDNLVNLKLSIFADNREVRELLRSAS